MLALHAVDVRGTCTTVNEYANLVDALAAFDFAKHDCSIGHVKIVDMAHPECVTIKDYTSLWAHHSICI